MGPRPSARAAYRRWYAAAGPWAGFFRAVPLVALAQGVARPRPLGRELPPVPDLAAVGRAEGWLGRPDVLLLLDFPGVTSLAVVVALGAHGVRPVLVLLLWPEPGALLAGGELLTTLLDQAPTHRRATESQYAFVLQCERASPATPTELATRFDNRYELGAIDLPSADRLRAAGIVAVIACRRPPTPPTPDLTGYLGGLEAAGLPIRRLLLGDE